jgi:1,4-alpha-glucan branching enzyme
MAKREQHSLTEETFGPPRMREGKLIFCYHDDEARSVALCGDFNEWNQLNTPLAREADGIWRVRIDSLRAGRYRYKFVIDDDKWVDDPANGLKEPDEFGGFNSLVNIT